MSLLQNMTIDKVALIVSIVAIILSIISIVSTIIISIKSWTRNRSIYDLEEFVIRKIDGSIDDADDRGFKAVKEKLETGKFAIESIQERKDGDWAILISKIKK